MVAPEKKLREVLFSLHPLSYRIKKKGLDKESMNKMEQIGRDEINKHNMFIRFTCTPEQII